jgi:hypothetical protein
MRSSVQVGQTEIVNKSFENYLRHFVAENQDDWDKLLLFAEFAYTTSLHESTGSTPFRLNYGFDPNLPSSFEVFEAMHPKKIQVAKQALILRVHNRGSKPMLTQKGVR